MPISIVRKQADYVNKVDVIRNAKEMKGQRSYGYGGITGEIFGPNSAKDEC